VTIADDTYFVKAVIFSSNMQKLDFTPFAGDLVRATGKMNDGSFIIYNIERL
jgi:exonuclease VII large subunit